MSKFTDEMLEKIKQMKDVKELLVLAKENDMEITKEEAKDYFEQINPQSDELADYELDLVAGGAINESQFAPGGITLVTPLQEENGDETKSSKLKFPSNAGFT